MASAEPICVTGKGAPTDPGPYLYLGEARNEFVLDRPESSPARHDLEPRPHSTFFLPTGELRITFLHAAVLSETDATGRHLRLDAENTCKQLANG